jgi:putative CocE/NonD family hydrolase
MERISNTRASTLSGVVWAVIMFLSASGSLHSQEVNARFSWPLPKYAVRLDKSVMVPMRDGVKLSTDIYRPIGTGEPLPVVLIRTPYNKRWYRQVDVDRPNAAHMFAGQGYAVLVQDTRGRFESEGEYTISTPDDRDGYDAVTWASTQPWSTGKVGTYGCSYLGEAQIETAKLRNPNLVAMIPQAAGGASRYFGQIVGGAVELATNVGWYWEWGTKDFLRPPAGAGDGFWANEGQYFDPGPTMPPPEYRRMWNTLPTVDIFKKFGAPRTDFENVLRNDPGARWWADRPYVVDTDHFDVPALHVDSWYDYGVEDVLHQFNLMRSNADSPRGKDSQFVIISPTSHCRSESVTAHTTVGERDMGDPRLDYYGIYLRWFDYWLRGIQNDVIKMPRIQIYVMGKNQWRGENEWPLARSKFTKYYFHGQGSANSKFGRGTLNTDIPDDEPDDSYVYDPGTPVQSVGGPMCCTGTADASEGSFDQAAVEARQDVLVFTTPVLKDGIEVTGPLEAVLSVSSSAIDTDFTAKLVDVYPDGKAYNVQEGILRARYREGVAHKMWMKPGEIYRITVDMQATSNFFGPGHRIRVEISSSNFPRFDRNLNTGGNNYDEVEWRSAHNTLHHSNAHPSYILLPVIPDSQNALSLKPEPDGATRESQ